MNHRYPPYAYLMQVAEHCPKAVSTYMLLWREMDKNNHFFVNKEDIRPEFLISRAKFRHDLFLLAKEGLISVQETPLTLSLEMVDWNDEN